MEKSGKAMKLIEECDSQNVRFIMKNLIELYKKNASLKHRIILIPPEKINFTSNFN